jgi:HEAT repeat protein
MMVHLVLLLAALQAAPDRLGPIVERWRSGRDDQRLQAVQEAEALPKEPADALLDHVSREKDPSWTGLAVPLLKHREFTVAWRATEILLQFEARDRVPQIAPLLKGADGSLRPNVLQALTRLGGREHGKLVAPFLDDADPDVALAAVELLGRFGSGEYAERIVRFLDSGEPTHRQAAIASLAAMGARETAEQIGKHLHDPAALVRWETVRALGHLRAREFAGQIVAMAEEDGAQAPVIEALGRLGQRELAPHLLPFLEVIEPGLRWRAVRALGDIDAKDDANRIAEMLQDLDSYVRRCALQALAVMGAKEQAGKMAALLRDEDPEVSKETAEQASALMTAEQLKSVLPLAGDEDGFVRWSAIRLLVRAEAKGSVPSLVERLRSGTGATRDLVWAIGRLGGPEQREAVAAATRNGDLPVRVQAAFALARLGGGSELDDAEKTTSAPVRLAASIGQLRLGRKDRAAASALLAEVLQRRDDPDCEGFTDEILDALAAGFEKDVTAVLAKPVSTSKRIESVKELEVMLAKGGVTQASGSLPDLRRRLPAGAALSARRALEWSFGPDARLVPEKGRILVLDPSRAIDHWRKRLQ